MFKGEYQGGPFLEVFGAQGRDTLSKKCKVTGTSTTVHKQYDKDVKSYVYVLEGEPTTTKIQFPKEDKQSLFLTQKFLVFQMFLPVGRPFSFEVAVTDHAQNKRRIFFSSNLKEVSVTPLHARFPLTILKLGSWLNLCLDLDSLVSETFNGPKFRAAESFTVTANCRLKKVFTLRAAPFDTSEDKNHVVYPDSEPLPKNLQLVTTSEVSTITQILTYGKLCSKANNNTSTPLSTPSGHECTTPREDQETHIAFGTKVVIPPHVRKNSFKENRDSTSTKIPYNSRLSSSKSKYGHSAPDVRFDDSVKSSLSPNRSQVMNNSNEPTSKGIDASPATIQPRPPKTSSAGKIRRPIRLKASSAGMVRTNGNTDSAYGKESLSDKQADTLESEIISSVKKVSKNVNGEQSDKDCELKTSLQSSNFENKVKNMDINDENRSAVTDRQKLPEKVAVSNYLTFNRNTSDIGSNADTLHEGMSLRHSHNVNVETCQSATTASDFAPTTSSKDEFRDEYKELSQVSEVRDKVNECENKNEVIKRKEDSSNDHFTNRDNILELSNDNMNLKQVIGSVSKSTNERSSDNMTQQKSIKNADINNNGDDESDKPRPKPRTLPLAGSNPVFTFASMPRSPRSGKRKMLGSSIVDDVTTPSVEAAPKVMISLAEDVMLKDPPARNGGPRNRGASLEDDFCKLSDEEFDEEEGDGIQKLLRSSLSPRQSPMPFHQQLRQSIRSSMLKEIPSPIKENGYDAQNYQSDDHLATLNQSTSSSWRFDTSDSTASFNQTQLENSLNNSSFRKAARQAIADIPVLDDNNEDSHSDCSDDTTYSTWEAPPQDLRGNKYQNEMKPPGQEPDLTATICVDSRSYYDVFSPPIILGTPNTENNGAIPITSPLKSPHKFPGVSHQAEEEEELDLLYDPCLNCYFDPKTHKYYELA